MPYDAQGTKQMQGHWVFFLYILKIKVINRLQFTFTKSGDRIEIFRKSNYDRLLVALQGAMPRRAERSCSEGNGRREIG